jgi:hypothetical protein
MRELEQLRAQAEINAMLPDGGDTHVALTLDGIDYPDRVSIFVLLLFAVAVTYAMPCGRVLVPCAVGEAKGRISDVRREEGHRGVE